MIIISKNPASQDKICLNDEFWSGTVLDFPDENKNIYFSLFELIRCVLMACNISWAELFINVGSYALFFSALRTITFIIKRKRVCDEIYKHQNRLYKTKKYDFLLRFRIIISKNPDSQDKICLNDKFWSSTVIDFPDENNNL